MPLRLKKFSSNFLFLMDQAQTKKMKLKNKRIFESNEEFFVRNGGILLEKQIALSRSRDIGAQQLRIFSAKEIEKATNNYDPALIAGSFRGLCVYKGTLDERTIAVKAPHELEPDPEVVDLFLTEVATAMVLHHSNLVTIYGCCLETYVPMVVYEFFSNQGPFFLHGESALNKPLTWNNRLRIATDIAYALSYMHNALSKPLVHRDVMSFCFLFDSAFHAKLGSFGYSVSITPGQPDQSFPVHGTPGYMDPEYVETKEVTEKCDVYSFGVLMLELITGREPVDMARQGIDLIDVFRAAVERDHLREMIDSKVLESGNLGDLQQAAQLALACVENKGEERPTMIDIVNELRRILCADNR